MNTEITAQSEREFFVHDFFLLRSVSGDFPLARRMRDGHQMDFYYSKSIFVFRSSVNVIETEGNVYNKEL